MGLLLGGAAPTLSPETDTRAALAEADRQRIAALRTASIATIGDYGVAGHLTWKLYSPPVGRLIRDQLEWWCEIGHRFGTSAPTAELYAQVMLDAREAGLA